jgi:phosphatidylserine/phosphatidylglycerophosphate/cardiolipin synthase-like enzyme
VSRSLNLRVAVTGSSWMGGNVGSVDTALRELLSGARRELQIATYELRIDAKHLLDILEDRLEAGVAVTMVVNRLANKPFSVREYLQALVASHPYFRLYTFEPPTEDEDLHAKLIVADRDRMIIGSANLSWRGLVENHEIAVRIEGQEVASVASAVDKLLGSAHIRQIRAARDI